MFPLFSLKNKITFEIGQQSHRNYRKGNKNKPANPTTIKATRNFIFAKGMFFSLEANKQ